MNRIWCRDAVERDQRATILEGIARRARDGKPPRASELRWLAAWAKELTAGQKAARTLKRRLRARRAAATRARNAA